MTPTDLTTILGAEVAPDATALKRYTKAKQAVTDLQKFCRKRDYRFRKEGFGREGDSWIRVVNTMMGSREVF